MSAAAVIILRIKKVFWFLRERQAVSPESAIPESEVPYSDRWYYRRLIEYGAVKRIGDRCYLDDTLAQQYLADRRRRGLIFTTLAVVGFCIFWLIRGLM